MRTIAKNANRVVVVGAGLSGLSAALHLAGRGRDVARLAVHRNWRRLGLGHKLIDASIARLIELRVKGILAFTPILHISQYFETIGFTVYRTAPFMLGDRMVPATAFYRAL